MDIERRNLMQKLFGKFYLTLIIIIIGLVVFFVAKYKESQTEKDDQEEIQKSEVKHKPLNDDSIKKECLKIPSPYRNE